VEAEEAGDTGESGGDQVVKITVGGVGELEGSESDIVEGLVVNAHNLIGASSVPLKCWQEPFGHKRSGPGTIFAHSLR